MHRINTQSFTMIKPQIQVRIRTIYGVEKIYPVCRLSQTFAAIAGTVTLSKENINRIKELGYEIEVVQDTIKL